jgi:hypothetical protein
LKKYTASVRSKSITMSIHDSKTSLRAWTKVEVLDMLYASIDELKRIADSERGLVGCCWHLHRVDEFEREAENHIANCCSVDQPSMSLIHWLEQACSIPLQFIRRCGPRDIANMVPAHYEVSTFLNANDVLHRLFDRVLWHKRACNAVDLQQALFTLKHTSSHQTTTYAQYSRHMSGYTSEASAAYTAGRLAPQFNALHEQRETKQLCRQSMSSVSLPGRRVWSIISLWCAFRRRERRGTPLEGSACFQSHNALLSASNKPTSMFCLILELARLGSTMPGFTQYTQALTRSRFVEAESIRVVPSVVIEVMQDVAPVCVLGKRKIERLD